MASPDPSKESLSLSLGKAFSFDVPSSPTPHERTSTLATTPLFTQTIWPAHTGVSLGDSWEKVSLADSWEKVSVGDSWENLQSMPWNMCMNEYDTNQQEETVKVNSGSGASSMSIWENQENPFGHNLVDKSEGGRSYMLTSSNSLKLYNGSASQNSFFSHQQSLSSAGLNVTNQVLALQESDIILLGKAQGGSQYLQKLISWKGPGIIDQIFAAVYKNPFDLMSDQHGHHLFVKLIESCSEDQLGQLTLKLTTQVELFFKASVKKYGSLSIMKLIKVLVGFPFISLVILALYRGFKDMMINRHGSSVIIHCLETLSDHQNELLYVAVINHFRDLATNVAGCISLNNFIDNMRGPHRGELLHLISSHAGFFAKDPSGNFVVQHVLGLSDPGLTEKICSLLRGKYVELSTMRYGSHVVEKCLKSPGMAHYVVDDFLKGGNQQLLQLARHKYGNYVVQRALKVTKSEDISLHIKLLKGLRDHHSLQFGFGRKVYKLIVEGVPVD